MSDPKAWLEDFRKSKGLPALPVQAPPRKTGRKKSANGVNRNQGGLAEAARALYEAEAEADFLADKLQKANVAGAYWCQQAGRLKSELAARPTVEVEKVVKLPGTDRVEYVADPGKVAAALLVGLLGGGVLGFVIAEFLRAFL